jgi:cell division protease FtsH
LKISIRIKKAVLYTLIAAFLLPITHIYSNPTQPGVSPSLAAKIEQAEAEIREKKPQTQEEALQLFKTFINSLSPEERAEFENLRQTIEEQASARPGLQLSPALQAKIQALQEKVLNGIDPQTLTPEKATALHEEILSQLTPEERAEFENFQQELIKQQTPQFSPQLQAKIEKVHKEVFKDVNVTTITPEQKAQLDAQFEEQLLSELTPEEREELEAATQPSQEINRQILSKVLEQLDGFARIGQFLADAMHNEQVKPQDPKKVLEYVQDIALLNRQVKDQFSQESNISLNTIINLVHLCNYLGNHLRYSIVTNLNDIKPLSIETALTRGNSSHINSPEDLEKEFEKNDKLLAELDAQAQSIGLAWYQKGYRQLEALDTKYNLRWNALKLSIVGTIAAITLHKLSAESVDSIPYINWTGIDYIKHNIVGDKFEYNKITGELLQGRHTTFGAVYDGVTNRLGYFGDMLNPALTLGSLYTFLLPDAAKWYTWSQEKLSNLATKLRGARAQYVFGGRREPHLTFDNQIGQTHIKDQMSRYISYLLDNKAYDHRGIGITCNVLFAGKSRTGKTYMAEAFVGELNRQLKTRGKHPVQFLIFSKLDIEKFGFKYILEYARDNAPCVVFIDEIDMLGLQPDQNSALLQEFLTALSGATESKLSGVCFLGATNRPESLYKSLLKRFDKVIWFDYPPYEDRKAAFAQDLSNHAIIASPAFIDRIARESEGCSFEDLHKIIVYASQQAETERRAVTENDLQTAVDSVIWKIEQKQCTAPQTQKQIMAAHLAGEALTRVLLPCHYKLAKVTLRDVAKEIREMPSYARYYKEASDQTHNSGKVLTYEPYHGTQINNAEQVHNECKTYLAGHIAEKVLLGQSSHIYCEANTSRALGLAKFLVLEGADLDQLPKEIKNKKTLAAYNLVETYKAEIETLLINNKATLETIAQELMKRETLSRAEIEAIIKRTSTNAQRAE